MPPGDRWLMAAHRDLRKSGLIRSGMQVSLMGGRPTSIWYLTERGLEAAREAKARVSSAREARSAWSRDFLEARRAAMTAERTERQEATQNLDPDPDPC
jgi:predicted ArsR family transcriptional regulator